MANAPLSMPTASQPVSDQSGRPDNQWWRLWYGLYVRATDTSILTTAGGQELIGGFTEQEYDIGTPINGSTVLIDPSNNLKQTLINNVAAFTISPETMDPCGDVELRIVNGPSAGTITFTGFNFNYPGGSILDTVNGNQFMVFIYGFGSAGADYIVRARQ